MGTLKFCNFFLLYVLTVSVVPMCMPGAYGSQKMVLDSLELELLLAVSHEQSQVHIGAGN